MGMIRWLGLAAIAITGFALADGGVDQAPFVPDHVRTAGALNPEVTQENIAQTVCVPGYSKTIRPPSSYTSRLRAKQMREIGLPGTMHDYHEDHLVLRRRCPE